MKKVAADSDDDTLPARVVVTSSHGHVLFGASLPFGPDELPFVYENNKAFAAFPTYPIVLGFKGSDQDIVAFPSEAMKKQPMCALPGKVCRRPLRTCFPRRHRRTRLRAPPS